MKFLGKNLWSPVRRLKKGLLLLKGNWLSLVLWPLVGLVAIAGLWGLLESRDALEQARVRTEVGHNAMALSKAYATQMAQSLEKLDDLTLFLKHSWETSGGHIDLAKLSARGVFSTAQSAVVLIAGPDGRAITSTRPFKPGLTFADRQYFQYHLANNNDGLRVGQPTVGRISGQRVIQMTRRLSRPDGSFDGVLIVSVADDFFALMPETTVFGKEGLQALVGDDGLMRVAFIGRSGGALRNDALGATTTCLATKQASLFSSACFPDAVPRYVASTSLGSYPFKAIVGLSEREALRSYLVQSQETHVLFAIGSALVVFLGLFAVALSVRLRIKRREASKIREAYRMATENGKDGFYLYKRVLDKADMLVDFQVVDCNERGAALYGKVKRDLVGTTFRDLYGAGDFRDSIVENYNQIYTTGYGEDEYEVEAGSLVSATWLHRKFVRTFEGLAVTLRDISDTVATKNDLARIALEDELTGLPNRRWLTGALPEILLVAGQRAQTVSILFIDLDNFKNVNDTLGHSAGDELLQAAAKRLGELMRQGDRVIRLGGDEFTVVLAPGCDDASVSNVAARIVQAFKGPFAVGGATNIVGASVGIAEYPRDGTDSESLLRKADMAMYAAKVSKGSFRFYSTDLAERLHKRLTTEQDLREALKLDQLVVYYQPRVRTGSGELVGMEALVRWMHPTRGLIMPDEFIPVAENSDLIVDIGEVVALKVAGQLARWRDDGLRIVPISVNVSPRQFDKGGVADLVRRCLQKTGLPATFIEVEITESAMMGDSEQIAAQLAALAELGIKIHVDDFGKGYSSLSLLQRLSLDVLKIDRAFTADLGITPESRVFYRAIVSMAHALGMTTVAEGVETAAQLQELRELGCDEIQGYLISKPLPALETSQVLIRYSTVRNAKAKVKEPFSVHRFDTGHGEGPQPVLSIVSD
ncbi:MAG: sensory box protein [Herminiimonas sp.]|nr:sensory box protein [Herminiimonas sp.]